jgi:hypothetical protein
VGYSSGLQCPFNGALAIKGNHGIWLTSNGNAPGGFVAHWEADPPADINLIGGQAPTYEFDSNAADTGAFFYWQSGNSGYLTSTPGEQGQSGPLYTFAPSRYFGWELACNASTQCGNTAYLEVNTLTLEAQETALPDLNADSESNLWYQGNKWVRGTFPIQLDAEDDSGVCQATISWDGQRQADPTTSATPNTDWWNQCDPGALPGATQLFFSGESIDSAELVPTSKPSVPLVITATNAAGNTTTDSEHVNVDNLPVSATLTGPRSASVDAGTQYVTASATAGPSGVSRIVCSIDGSRWTSERLSGANSQHAETEIPVTGLGQHQVSCYAENGSVDAAGIPAASPTRTWSLRIAQPVDAGITVGRVIVHCRRVVRRVATGGRWVTVRHHRKWVRGQTKTEHVLACHATTPRRLIARIGYGRRATVSGWLTAGGAALAHVPLRILAAPDDGQPRWRTAGVVRTSRDGSWSARLRRGPSRVIEAVYAGASTTLPARSQKARVLVSARIALDPIRTDVPWGGVLVIRGRVLGGYIPQEQILQMLSGVGRHLQVIGNPFIRRDGRFTIKLAATGSGGPIRTQIAIGTLKETNYPYARGISKRIWVTLG